MGVNGALSATPDKKQTTSSARCGRPELERGPSCLTLLTQGRTIVSGKVGSAWGSTAEAVVRDGSRIGEGLIPGPRTAAPHGSCVSRAQGVVRFLVHRPWGGAGHLGSLGSLKIKKKTFSFQSLLFTTT